MDTRKQILTDGIKKLKEFRKYLDQVQKETESQKPRKTYATNRNIQNS